MINEGALAARAEDFGLERIPAAVLIMTAGCDVQDDRIEVPFAAGRTTARPSSSDMSSCGAHSRPPRRTELDDFLRTRWRHPHGGMLKIDCALLDASDGDHYAAVLAFTIPRIGRRIFASKGLFGARPIFAMSTSKRLADRLALVGVDTVKGALFDKLSRGRGVRFSKSLEPSYYEQLASERRVVRYVRGMPARRFERIGRARAEALDCLVYATAAREAVKNTVNLARREAELKGAPILRRPISDYLPRWDGSSRPAEKAPVPSSFIGERSKW